jgi:hypothetical protein
MMGPRTPPQLEGCHQCMGVCEHARWFLIDVVGCERGPLVVLVVSGLSYNADLAHRRIFFARLGYGPVTG